MTGSGPASPGNPLHACRHVGRPGTLDESARRLSHEELAVARVLVQEGHQVSSQAERRGTRTGDLMVCGTEVEVKSFAPVQSRARPASPESVANKLLRAKGQGTVAVIWAKGSGLTPVGARAGFALFSDVAARQGAGGLRAARVIGDGYDVSFLVQLRLSVGSHRARRIGVPTARPGGPPKMSA
jgi:hypothetical protein